MSMSPSKAAPTKNPDNESRRAWDAKLRAASKELDLVLNLLRRGQQMTDEQWRVACARIWQ